ncbi:MAG: helix-turn-helix domain-containing protein [Spirochaetaceae bacterium]|nr:helix-turn-helix domain-containing protein [Spirochaetaceae bacterium]
MDIKVLFGNNLRRYRKKAGLSQEILAETLQISTQHISNIETGRKFVSAGLLQELIGLLKVSPSLLFYDPEVQITDETYLETIDAIIRKELESSLVNIKHEIYKHIDSKEAPPQQVSEKVSKKTSEQVNEETGEQVNEETGKQVNEETSEQVNETTEEN